MMRILVIGGMQFMGRRIVELLAERGDEVTVMHRRGSHDLGPKVRNLQADRGDLQSVARALEAGRFDVIVDTAYDWQHGTPASHVEAAARSAGAGLHRYVFMSSAAVYVPGLGLNEESPLVGDDEPNPYAVHKASAERLLFTMHRESGFPAVTFRPPFVHGPRQPFYREQFFWDRLLDGRPIVLPDGGDTPTQWVFVEDIARACVRAIDVPEAAGQAFGVGHVEPLTQRIFVEALARVARITPRFVPVARERIRAAGGQLIGPRVYYGDYLDLAPFSAVVGKASRVLGITPTPLEEALRQGYAWYQSQPRRAVDYTFEDGLIGTSSTGAVSELT
jgi:nucleoside-diphosphate-sugar epimerase